MANTNAKTPRFLRSVNKPLVMLQGSQSNWRKRIELFAGPNELSIYSEMSVIVALVCRPNTSIGLILQFPFIY